jgi:hypothetical protein
MKKLCLAAAVAFLAPSAAVADPITAFSLFGGNSTGLGGNVTVFSGLVGSNGNMGIGADSDTLTLVGGGTLSANGDIVTSGDVVFNGNVTVGADGHVTGDIDSGGNVTLLGDAIVDGSIRAAGNVSLGSGASVGGDVDAGDATGTAVSLGNGATVVGTVTHKPGTVVNCGGNTVGGCNNGASIGARATSATPDAPTIYTPTMLPSATSFVAGTMDITKGAGQTTTLAVNSSWDAISLGGTNVLNISAGTYRFNTWNIGAGSTLNLDLTGGAIVLLFTGNVMVGGNLTVNLIGGTAADVYAETYGNWTLGTGGDWRGTIFGSGATSNITFNGTTDLVGALYAKNNLDVGANSTVNFVQSNYLAPPSTAVPEPTTLAMLAAGLLGAAGRSRRWRRR